MKDKNWATGKSVTKYEDSVSGIARGRMPGLVGLGLGVALVLAVAGCHKTPAQNSTVAQVDQNPGDPADANMAPVGSNGSYAAGQPAQVLGQNVQYQPQQQGEDYAQQPPAPIERIDPSTQQNYDAQSDQNAQPDAGAYNNQEAEDVYASDLTDAEADTPPPPLPDYEQPPAPDPDYLWTPGYWAWGYGGYYWVPGSWVAAPYIGALWTPGYWGYVGNRYRFHHGFWGLHIGFYGGIDYGYGYTGYGYYGGYWNRGSFYYNTAVNRVNSNVIRNVYTHNVVVNGRTYNGAPVNRVSFNGGRAGVQAQPRAAEVAVLHEKRTAPMASQVLVQHQAAQNRSQFYNQNKGRPAVVVNARPVVADRTMPATLPRVSTPVGRAGFTGGTRPGAPQQMQPQVRSTQPVSRPGQVQSTPLQPQVRQSQPQLRPATRPTQPNVQERPVPQASQRQQYEQRRQTQSAPQEQARPAQQPRPQEQARPQQAAPPPRPAPPAHDAAASHRQPDSHAGQDSRPQGDPHADDRQHR